MEAVIRPTALKVALDKHRRSKVIAGASSSKGSSSGGSEADDTLESKAFMSILDLLGEGQIGGLVDNSPKSIFLNDTPLMSNTGQYNFDDVTWAILTGAQIQDSLGEGFDNAEFAQTLNQLVKNSTPLTFTITDPNASQVRVVVATPALISTDSKGNINGTSVRFTFALSLNSGPFEELGVGQITGKTRSRYQREYSHVLPKTTSTGAKVTSWTIRVARTSPDSTSSSIQNDLYVDSYSVAVGSRLTYPNSAIVGINFNAEQFSSVPSRSYLVDGLLIKVPTNYDPKTRSYTGVWDGTFKLAVTDNPAWILYDVITNARYGLGSFIDPSLANPARLYAIGRYCDEMVDDGFGKKEPRFSINTCINSRADAYQLISDISSVFNGMTYWTGGLLGYMADMPTEVSMVYSAANVIDGLFNYSGAARKDMHSVVLVTWNDPERNYQTSVEYVEDQSLIERFGIRKAEITSFGCTSRGQAHRIGKWLLYTERYQSKTISFNVGIDSAFVLPGDVVKIVDADRAGARLGGRLKKVVADFAVLDAPVDTKLIKANTTISMRLPDGSFIERLIKSVGVDASTGEQIIYWDTALTKLPLVNAMWVISSPDLEPQLARIVAVGQGQNPGEFSITAIPHNPEKFDHIESDILLETPVTSLISPSVIEPTASVTVVQEARIDQGITVRDMSISWEQVPNAVSYEVKYRKGEGNWLALPATKGLSVDVQNIYQGEYQAQVTAISATGSKSRVTYSDPTLLDGQVSTLPKLAIFTAKPVQFGIELDWQYGSGTSGVAQTEIYSSLDGKTFTLMGAYPDPTKHHAINGLYVASTIWFKARIADKYGNYGEWSSVVSASPDISPDKVLDVLSNSIGPSQLSSTVNDKIENTLTTAQKAVSDAAAVSKEVKAEAAARVDALTAVSTAISDETTARTTAIANEAESRAAAISAGIAQEVNDRAAAITAESAKLAKSIAQEVTDRKAAVSTESTNRTNAIKAESTARTNAIAKEVSDRNAAIKVQVDALVAADAAEAAARSNEIASNVSALNATITANVKALNDGITQEITDRKSGDTAVLGELNAYKTSNDTSVAAVLEKAETAISNDAATASKLTGLESTVKSNDTAVRALVASETKTRTSADTALSGRIDSLTTTVNDNNTSVTGKIADVVNSVSTLEGNVNTKTTELANQISDNDNAAKGLIQDVAKSVTTLEGSTNTKISQLQSSLNTTNTNVSKKADATTLNALDSKVTNIDSKTTSNTSAITALQGRASTIEGNVAKKADAAALTALTTRVTNAENENVSQSNSMISLKNSFTAEQGRGANLIANGSFDTDASLDGLAKFQLVDGGHNGTAKCMKSLPGADYGEIHFKTIRGFVGPRTFKVQFATKIVEKSDTLGQVELQIAYKRASDENFTQFPFVRRNLSGLEVDADWVITTGFITIPAEANTLLFRVVSAPNTTSGSFLIDSCCFYDVTEAYDAQKQADANSAAISGLDSSVSEINGKLTAQASSNAQLQSNINAVDAKAGTAINNAANAQQTANTAVTKADSAAQATATLKSSYDTKMSALDQADRDATAKITQTNADLTSAKTTLANADKALGGRIDTLTATVSNNKTSTDASIKSATDSIATLNNAVTTKTDILTASIKAANVASGDLIPNPTFDPAYDQMGFTVVASTDSGVPKDCPFPYVAKLTGRDHYISGAHNIPCKTGDVFELSALVACGAGNYDFNLYTYRRPTATSTQFVQTDSGGNVKAASATTWKRATWRWTVPENPNPFFTPFLQINQNNGQGGVWYATDWHVINVTAAAQAQSKANANATAISGINASVDTINGALTSQSSSIASLQNAVTDINTKTGQLTNATAAAQSTANSAVSANQSLSERVNALTTTVGNNDATVKGQIQDVAKSVTSLEGNTNTKIGTLQSSINNLAVGGVNLFAFAKLKNGYITGAGDFSATAGTGCQKATDYYIEVGSNKYLTYQLWNPSLLVNTANSARIAFFDANKKLLKVSELTRLSTALAYYRQTWELPAGTVYVRLNAVLNTNNAALPSPDINVQFEWGNLPTAWTPALEDTQAQFDANATAIDSTKTEVSRVNGVVVAQGSSISKLQSDLNTVDSKTNSAISNAATAQTTANTAVSANNAVAERVSNLETSLDTVKGDVVNKANSSAVEALTNRVTDVEGELTTQASDMTNLQASLNVTDAKASNALPKVSGLDKYKTFKNVLGYYLANGNYSGNLVIQTPITISQKMCNVSIKGYNYRTDGASIDLNVGFYANSASSQIVSSGVVNNGTFPVKVRLGVRGSKVVIILSTSGYNFAYSQFAVDAEIGYTTVPDDWVNGWSCFTSAESDLASVQGISNIINPSQFNPRTEIASNVAATNALTTRVTNAENALTAQATRTTNLETALSATSAAVDTKASQSAVDTLDNQLSIVDGKVTANTNSINSLKTSVNSVEGQLSRKVDASTLVDYYTKVQADQATAGQINKYDASLAVDSTNIANSPNVGQWVSETDGTLSSDSSQIIYPLIAIRGSTKYYISTSSGQMQYGHYAIYDADKKFVTGGVPPSAGVVIDTPSNAAYITISYAFALSGAGELLLANSGKPVAFSVPFSTMQAAFSTYSSAIQSTNTNVTNINGKVTANSNSIASQASRLTAVENGVKTKAENSAVQTLNTEVTRIAGELKSTTESSTKLSARIGALDSDSLVPDYNLADVNSWYSEVGVDLTPYFQKTTTGKVGNTAFVNEASFAPQSCWNYSRTSLPNTRGYRISMEIRRSTNSTAGESYFTVQYLNTKGEVDGYTYAPTPLVVANGTWQHFDCDIDLSNLSATKPQLRFGFAVGHNAGSARGKWEVQGFKVSPILNVGDMDNSVATADAVNTLGATVARQGDQITSSSQQLTSLNASIKNLPIGGGNLLVNGDFSLNDISPWALEKSGDDVNATAVVLQKGNLDAWQADAGPSKTVSVHCSNSFTQDQGKWLEFYQTVPVVGGKMYQFSAYTGSHRCRIEMFSRQFDANGNPLLATYTPNDADTVNEDGTTGTRNGGKLLSGYKRLKQNFQAHASATTVRFVLRLMLRQDSYMFMTRAMFAEIADLNANPLAWIESGSGAALSSAANASAVQNMRALVDATSTKVTSLAEQNTALQAGLQSANGAIATKAEQSALNTTNSVLNTVSGKVETQAQSINTLTSKTTTMANDISNTELLARAMSSGKLLFGDPTFKTGTNGTTVYNNASNGAVTVARVAKQSSNPTSSGYEMKITVTGAAAPALGGFVQTISSRANAVFLIKYIICLPLGYALYTAANAMGDGASDKFIGNVNGTGKYETYYRLIKCGSTGTFNTTGFVYVAGPTPSAQSPLNWYLASIEAYDTTDFDDMTPQLRTTVAEVQSKVNTLTTNTGATAEKVESMSAYFNPGETVDGSGTADSGNNGAVRWTYHSMIAEGDLANAKAIDNMKAEMDGTFAEWGQVINSEVRQGISAVSEQLNHVSTTLNDQTTRIDTVMASIDGVYGKYVVKIDNNGVLSGFELVSQGGDDGQVVSTFGVNADDFYIGSPATGKRPFIVTTTPRVINGVTYPPGTWIDSAYIAEASIQMAHIDKASITSLSAISATIGTLRTATTGARTEISDNLIQVYDENNVLRVRIGVWS